MVITPEKEYPIVCVNIRKGFDGRSLKLDMVNLNSPAFPHQSPDQSADSSGLDTEESTGPMDGYATVIPRHELMNVQAVVQLEKDTILVCYDSKFCYLPVFEFFYNIGPIFYSGRIHFNCFHFPSYRCGQSY